MAEVKPLLLAHWAEIAHYQDILLDPDWDAYRAVEAAGMLRIYTARTEGNPDAALAGYCVFVVRKNLHYKQSLQASQDILFLHQGFRGHLFGYRFVKWCDHQLRAEGVQAVYQHVKAAHNFGPMLERIGYRLVDLIYSRRLDV